MNGRHRGFVTLASIFTVLSLLLMFHPQPAQAQQGATVAIVDYKVQTMDGKDTQEPLMAGSSYIISFSLQIAKGVTDTISLDTDLKLVGNQYWDLPADYLGDRLKNISPARKQISFGVDKEGKAPFKLTGEVPAESVAIKLPNNQFLHQQAAIKLLVLSSGSGTIKDTKSAKAIDKSIETYNNVFAQKRSVVEGLSLDPFILNLVAAMVKEAQGLATAGNTDAATAILNDIPDKGWPQAATSSGMLWIFIIALAVIALLLAFLMIKGRGSAGYTKGVIEDQVKKLDVVSVKAGRLGDKVLVQEINSVKDELDRISR